MSLPVRRSAISNLAVGVFVGTLAAAGGARTVYFPKNVHPMSSVPSSSLRLSAILLAGYDIIGKAVS
jgi:hypothetical protein